MASPDSPAKEVVVAWPPRGGRPVPLARTRSTLLSSAVATLRARGFYDRYLANLEPRYRQDVDALVAGTWLPVELALAHYDACERMGLTSAEASDMGAAVAARAYDSWLQTVRKLATGVGLTPWTVIAQYDRLWQRAFDGGTFRIERSGPKDAVLHIGLFPLARFSYFRSAFTGLQLAGLSLFATRCYARIVPGSASDDGFAVRAAWV